MSDPRALPRRRGVAFRYSDVADAADQFIEAIAEHSDPVWELDDQAELSALLLEKALKILDDPKETW